MTTHGKGKKRTGEMARLYQEFASYYVQERACWVAEDPIRDGWAPHNPRRLFNLAVKVWRAYRKRLPLAQMLAAAYSVLGSGAAGRDLPGMGTRPRPGLFRQFDPALYRGRRPLADHFANLFKTRLWANLRRSLRPRTDNGRKGGEEFQAAPMLGIYKQANGRRSCQQPAATLEEALAAAAVLEFGP
jgi:hypothetical protein